MGGVVQRVMIDNTHVVVLRGTGREMIPVPDGGVRGTLCEVSTSEKPPTD